MEMGESSEDELGRLDIDLDRKSKQHNLTSSNVRTILHEVITHEHVVAMMKATIRDTQDLPMFEPKMTRSRLKKAVQEGQVNLISPQPPQFVNIDLDDDEDSSDEEYCPKEEEEEDTAEETFFSDAESLSSPPRMHLGSQVHPVDQKTEEPLQSVSENQSIPMKTSRIAPQHHPTAPPECSFLERLNAVEEELDCSPAFTYDQSLDRKEDEGGLAYRTRSRRPLVNVPLDQLEAELLAPDITADMYDQSHAHREEDRHWTKWLQSLMAPDCEEEADDDDDPEYNFLDDLDEPDLEDYRTDRAVQITKKEVNELLEELFDTLQEEDVAAEDEEREEEEAPSLPAPKFNVPQVLRFEAPLASMLTERRQTVRKQYEALQLRRALQDTTNHPRNSFNLKDAPYPQPNATTSILLLPTQTCPALHLDHAQKLQLQQQLQQHVQLLTQVHLLSRGIQALNHEAAITKQYLEELQQFGRRQEEVCLWSSFRVCNLQGALDILQEVEQRVEPPNAPSAPPPTAAEASRRLLPQMTSSTSSHAFPLLSADAAWLFATRPIFMYPELLPVCSLDPALHNRGHRNVYMAGEDGLIVLGLKHFEGTVHSDQLISSYLLCKSRWNIRKHIREMSSPKAPNDNVIKIFLTQGVVPQLPPACSRVQPEDQRPPVDKDTFNMPNWLKNSQLIIQKTRLDTNHYPPSLPPGCSLRLHPYYVSKSRPPRRVHRRLFTLAHNASLLPIAKAPEERQLDRKVDLQPVSYLTLPPPSPGVTLLPDCPPPLRNPPLASSLDVGAISFAAVHPVNTPSSCADLIRSNLSVGRNKQQNIFGQEQPAPYPLFLPLPSLSTHNTATPSSAAAEKPDCFLLQIMWTSPGPTCTSLNAPRQKLQRPMKQEKQEETLLKLHPTSEEEVKMEEENPTSTSTLSPLSSCGGQVDEEQEQQEEEKEERTVFRVKRGNPEETKRTEAKGVTEAEGEEEEKAGGNKDGEQAGEGGEDRDWDNGAGDREEDREQEDGGGDREEDREPEEGGGDREEEDRDGEDGEKEKEEDQDRQGEEEEEEEEEDFDDLTQDEDEEEVMSSASEESVLSVPELQETMKQLTWLAAEQRLCPDGDSEEDHSPTSPGSQEEEEEEEEGPKEEESEEGRGIKVGLDEEMPSGEGTPRGGGRCPGRGRGRSRPHRGLRRSRQERHSKDAAKLLLLFDENILDNDPHRDSKDMAFAQNYLNRVREALKDTPEQVEEFVSLLNKFDHVGDEAEVTLLFSKLRCILGNRPDLFRDFAAFLHPEQALQCGLFEEQQAFDRSRRFLRQLEISFGDNPSHYQKIIKALQTGTDLNPTSIQELKAQMATLLKGHTHLQAEFWVFFDDLRPPPAYPGQFEETHWPEEEGGEGIGQVPGGVASGGFEEVTLPELEEEEEGQKSQPMTSRRQRRKMDPHRNYKDCDWSEKEWSCLCRDVKIRRHKRKGCSRCHGNQTSVDVTRAVKSLNPLYTQISTAHDDHGEKTLDLKGSNDSPQPVSSSAPSSSPPPASSPAPPSVSSLLSSPPPPRPNPLLELPVCAKNISLTASGEKVILWTREADRVILTTCQQEGANQNTFQAISNLLGNKTPTEVSRRFRDLMRLFRTAARHTTSEDEGPPTEPRDANEMEDKL
ncbi:GON-4-like protein [Xenentodon cancila]